MISKNKLLIISLLGTIIFFVSLFATQLNLCGINNHSCSFVFDPIAETAFIFIPLFLLCIFTYKIYDKIFQSWIKFVYWWLPLTVFIVILVPQYSNSLLPITKDSISFFMSILFLIISLILIIAKHFSLKKSATQNFSQNQK